HYQDAALDWGVAPKLDYGYLGSSRAIYVRTVASRNSHRLRIFVNEEPASSYERCFNSILLVSSGILRVSAPANVPEDDVLVKLDPGAERVAVCSSAIGVDELGLYPERGEPMSDEELFLHDDLEHYDLFIRPGA